MGTDKKINQRSVLGMLRATEDGNEYATSGRSPTLLNMMGNCLCVNSGFMLVNLSREELTDDVQVMADKLKTLDKRKQEQLRQKYADNFYFYDPNHEIDIGFVPLRDQGKNWHTNDVFHFFVEPTNCPGLADISTDFDGCGLLFSANPYNFTNAHRSFEVFDYAGNPISMLESMKEMRETENFEAVQKFRSQNPAERMQSTETMAKIIFSKNIYVRMQLYLVNPKTQTITPIEKHIPFEILKARPNLMYFCLDAQTRKEFNEWKKTFDHNHWDQNEGNKEMEENKEMELNKVMEENKDMKENANGQHPSLNAATNEDSDLEEWKEGSALSKGLYNYKLPGNVAS